MTQKRYLVTQNFIDCLSTQSFFHARSMCGPLKEIPEGTLFPTKENLEAMLDRVAIDDWDSERFEDWIKLWNEPGEIYESQEGKEDES